MTGWGGCTAWTGRAPGARRGPSHDWRPARTRSSRRVEPLDAWLLETLPGDRDAILRADDYRAWLHGATPLDTESCASYRRPLGLGGADDVANLERTSFIVHVSISGQLAGQIRDLPPGTAMSGITLQ